MKTNLLFSSILITAWSISQGTATLDENNVNAKLNTNGIFFQDIANSSSGYEVPKGMQTNAIYSSAFWYGGLDANNQLHFAGAKYGTEQDFYSGPIATNYTTPNFVATYLDQLWMVTSLEVQNHIANYSQAGYITPNSITNWPAHGDVNNGEAENLAPFIDRNYNGIYDPENGDVPNIRGDKAVYLITNDAAGPHTESNGEPLGMEFHYMIYQYNTNDYLNNTTFINTRVYNRSQTTYFDFKAANYVDPDLGDAGDDYIGCAPEKNMMFTYNSNNFDQNSNGSIGYGANPPALGIVFLSHTLNVFGYYRNSGSAILGDPNTASEYWGFMNAYFGTSGIPFTVGGDGTSGSVPTNHLFSDNPNDSGWSQVNEGSEPYDYRILGVTPGETFSPGEYICYDYAILYERSGNNLENVDSLYSLSDQVHTFYSEQESFSCESIVLSLDNINTPADFSIAPNPSNGSFKIQLEGEFDVLILSITGEIINIFNKINSTTTITTDLPKGIYIAQIIQDGITNNKRIIIN